MSSRKGSDVHHLNQVLGDMSFDSRHNRASQITSAFGRPSNNPWRNDGASSNAIPQPREKEIANAAEIEEEEEEIDESDDDLDESDEELISDDESPQTHEKRKNNRWFTHFFQTLDSLNLQQINEPARQWHCPACKNGPGSIDWYNLHSLATHAKTKGSKRVKLHRHLAELLDQELRRRGAALVPPGESYGKWKGLNEVVKDKQIVWPPMVVIMNTQLEQDDNQKWVGMGNQELLDYFGSYQAVRARHSYGPKGHRGMSVLMFEGSAVGYTEAERLSKHFEHQGTDRHVWDHRPILFYPGGKRQLYGYMATKKDLDIFNQHSPGKLKLKFEMVSYQDKVVNELRRMNEDNQQLQWYKNKIVKEQKHLKALEESFDLVSQKLRKTEEEQRIVRQKTQLWHQQNNEEMDYQEQFFKDQLKKMQEARNAKEEDFEKMQQKERRKAEQSYAVEDPDRMNEKLEDFIDSQTKEMKEFEEEREKLMKRHQEKKAEIKKQRLKLHEEEVELEKGFNMELDHLMDKYTISKSKTEK